MTVKTCGPIYLFCLFLINIQVSLIDSIWHSVTLSYLTHADLLVRRFSPKLCYVEVSNEHIIIKIAISLVQ